MIRLATVFSGIGAIEHALERMGLNSEIVFACDNGEVNILTKDIGTDMDAIKEDLTELEKQISEIKFKDDVNDLYKKQLENMLDTTLEEFDKVWDSIGSIPDRDNSLLTETANKLIQADSIIQNRKKEYKKLLDGLNRGTKVNCKLEELLLLLALNQITHPVREAFKSF